MEAAGADPAGKLNTDIKTLDTFVGIENDLQDPSVNGTAMPKAVREQLFST